MELHLSQSQFPHGKETGADSPLITQAGWENKRENGCRVPDLGKVLSKW